MVWMLRKSTDEKGSRGQIYPLPGPAALLRLNDCVLGMMSGIFRPKHL
jgi:hypothetical protein